MEDSTNLTEWNLTNPDCSLLTVNTSWARPSQYHPGRSHPSVSLNKLLQTLIVIMSEMREQFSLYYWCSVPMNDTHMYNSDVFSFSHIVTNSPVFVTSPDGSVLIAPICLKAQTAIVSLTSSHCGCLVIRDQRQEVTWAESSQSEASVEVTWLILTNQGVRSPDHRMLFSPDYDGPSLRLTMNPLILNTSTSDVKQTITWAQFKLNKLSSAILQSSFSRSHFYPFCMST